MDYSQPGSSVHEISQARILEWVVMAFSRESSQPRDGTLIFYVFCIGRWSLYHYHLLGSPIIRQYWDKKSSLCCLCALPNLSCKILTATGRVNSHTHIYTVFWIIKYFVLYFALYTTFCIYCTCIILLRKLWQYEINKIIYWIWYYDI